MSKVGRNQFDFDERPWTNKETLQELYHGEGLSARDIGDRLGCSNMTIRNWMQKHGIEMRKPAGERPPCFTLTAAGYETWRSTVNGTNHGVLVHRLLAVAQHGFDKVAGRVVHHKNGIPWDNRPGNIEVMNRSEHTSLHGQERSEKLSARAKTQERHPEQGWFV